VFFLLWIHVQPVFHNFENIPNIPNIPKIENFKPFKDYKVWVSMTTLPERISTSHFEKYLDRLLHMKHVHGIFIHLPLQYKKFGNFENWKEYVPLWIQTHKRVYIVHPQDDGPATKLFGNLWCPLDPSLLTSEDLLLVVDDDLLYHDQLVPRMVDVWSMLFREWDKERNKKFILGNVVYPNPQRPQYMEVQASAGYLLPLLPLLSDLPSFYEFYTSHKEPCWNVDDTFLSYCFVSHHYVMLSSGIPIPEIYDHEETHPAWFELRNTHREIDTQECLVSLTSNETF